MSPCRALRAPVSWASVESEQRPVDGLLVAAAQVEISGIKVRPPGSSSAPNKTILVPRAPPNLSLPLRDTPSRFTSHSSLRPLYPPGLDSYIGLASCARWRLDPPATTSTS